MHLNYNIEEFIRTDNNSNNLNFTEIMDDWGDQLLWGSIPVVVPASNNIITLLQSSQYYEDESNYEWRTNVGEWTIGVTYKDGQPRIRERGEFPLLIFIYGSPNSNYPKMIITDQNICKNIIDVFTTKV